MAVAALLLWCSCSRYDVDKADSKANRRGFEQCFGFPAGDSVTGVYFFADEWGGDAQYCLAFFAPQEVIDRIIREWELSLVAAGGSAAPGGTVDSLPWWDAGERRDSKHYRYEDEAQEISRQLWYNPETQKCQAVIVYW